MVRISYLKSKYITTKRNIYELLWFQGFHNRMRKVGTVEKPQFYIDSSASKPKQQQPQLVSRIEKNFSINIVSHICNFCCTASAANECIHKALSGLAVQVDFAQDGHKWRRDERPSSSCVSPETWGKQGRKTNYLNFSSWFVCSDNNIHLEYGHEFYDCSRHPKGTFVLCSFFLFVS